MPLTQEQVRWVAQLARLELAEDELALLTQQLGAILDFMEQLRQVDTRGVEPLAHPCPIYNVFRADHPEPSLPVAEALANAPCQRDGFFLVPPVLD
jgi:aspartyl-tRNA(Asn)/glutamyl-tRNA(Gln) amidotransferase subunit C